MRKSDSRDLDVVLLGATGFVGALTAEQLAAHAPEGLRWGLAGRRPERLHELAERLGADVPVLQADVEDEASLRRLAESTSVLATTVGPYLRYGDGVVAACAEAGTDYLDLTGELEFVDRTWLRHQDSAVRSGARLVHACGFDSIPYDLGALFTVEHLPQDVPLAVRGYVTARGSLSGGTLASVAAIAAHGRKGRKATSDRRAQEPRPAGRRVRRVTGRPHREPDTGRVALPLSTLDPVVVVRSAAELDRYGPDFAYSHFASFPGPITAAALSTCAVAGLLLAALPPSRRLLLRLRPPGSGPSAEQRAKSWFRVRFVGEGGGRRVVTEVSGGDPGYGETAVMLAEAATCLAVDDLPPTRGQVTTAVAMGPVLRQRLQRRGITFQLVDES